MKGDFSRLHRFTTATDRRVMLQQGRVLLDSDWNEQTHLILKVVRNLTRDIFGPFGGPDTNLGFKISRKNGEIAIGPGRYYVQGIAVDNHYKEPHLFSEQLGFKNETLSANNYWLVYLDVWEDYVAPEQDFGLIEQALGGANTAGRARTFWQVKGLVISESISDEIAGARETPNFAEAFEKALSESVKASTGQMSARIDANQPNDSLCVIPPDARYTGLENQLYRVEIHRGGEAGDATFKWSRDNASVLYPITKSAGNMFTLSTLGRDSYTELREGMWVEYVDDELTARNNNAGSDGNFGPLARVKVVNRDDFSVILELPSVASAFPSATNENNPVLRRWDHQGLRENLGALAINSGQYIELEDGIKIKFKSGLYKAGDYWSIPARVGSKELDWPGESTGTPVMLPAFGIHHYHAPLALLRSDGSIKDLRIVCSVNRSLA